MLVISRKLGEKVVINPGQPDEFTITIAQIDRGKISLAFDAPISVKISREELLNPNRINNHE